MKTKILGDRVLIKVDETADAVKTKSGLFITGDAAREEMVFGEVVSVGPGKKDTIIPSELREGAKVVFIKYSASQLVIDEVEYSVVRMDDLIAVLDS